MRCLDIYAKSNPINENPLDGEDPTEAYDNEREKIAFIDIKEEPVISFENADSVDEYNIESIIEEDGVGLGEYLADEEHLEENLEMNEHTKLEKKPRQEVLNFETGKIEVLIKPRKSYTPQQKLEIIKFAEIESNRSAMRKFEIDESCIRRWRVQKETIQNIFHEQQTSNRIVSNRKPRICWPDLERELKDWVVENKDRGIMLKPYEIKATAIEIAKNRKIDNFKGTSSFIFKFMQRNDIASPPPKKSKKKEKVKESYDPVIQLPLFPIQSSLYS